MIIDYPNKKDQNFIISSTPRAILKHVSGNPNSKNKLIRGNNSEVLQALMMDYGMKGKIDLVYIDPPFSTNGYFAIGNDRVSTISKSLDDEIAYFDNLVGENYLEFLRERLLLLRELMSDRASIYLHIDYKIGHYVKVMMDEIFGVKNFRNDIARIKCNPKNFNRKGYGNIKDMILFYSKTDRFSWHPQYEPLTDADIERLFPKTDANGRKYTTIPLHAPGETRNGKTGQEWRGIKPPKGRHWRSEPAVLEQLDKDGLVEWSSSGVPRKKIYADERDGKILQDIWEFKDAQYPSYPTEKNLDMLRIIISASSETNDYVLDCFCGSGTTLQASWELGRNWIGVDNSEQAIKTTQKRLSKFTPSLFATDSTYEMLNQDGSHS